MRFVHSFSTLPQVKLSMYDINPIKRLLGNVIYYALSVAYLKKLNQTVILYTDSLGAALLGHLPYDEIHCILDDVHDNIHPRYWAKSKIYAFEKEPIGSIHIDGDVFIKTEELLKELEESEWDVIVQSEEHGLWYEKCCPFYYEHDKFFSNLNFDIKDFHAYNTGIVGFRNAEVKQKFIDNYKTIAKYFSTLYTKVLDTQTFYTPDLLPEQQSIYLISKNYKTKVLLRGLEEASIKGYQHVVTGVKFNQLDKCMNVLSKISPEIYEKTYKLCQNILKQ